LKIYETLVSFFHYTLCHIPSIIRSIHDQDRASYLTSRVLGDH
jgi:hypothetical protein